MSENAETASESDGTTGGRGGASPHAGSIDDAAAGDGRATGDATGVAEESDAEPIRLVAPAATLSAAVETVAALVSECRVRFGPSAVTFRATDPAQAALVQCTADADAFESYRGNGTTVGVEVDRLSEVVSLAEGLVTLTVRPDARRLRVEGSGVRFETSVLAPDRVRDAPERETLERKFDYEAWFGTEAAAFERAVRAAEMVSDYLVVRGDAAGVSFVAEGDTDECEVRLPADELSDPSLGPAESIFSLDYLSIVARATPTDADLRVAAGAETPAAVAYDAADGVRAEWVVSPRIAR